MVQGVAFRYYAQRWASERGLTGWVRNRDDGRVEVAAEGDRAGLEAFVFMPRDTPVETEDTAVALLWFASGALGTPREFAAYVEALNSF